MLNMYRERIADEDQVNKNVLAYYELKKKTTIYVLLQFCAPLYGPVCKKYFFLSGTTVVDQPIKMASDLSPVQKFYDKNSIFLTGATGFLGMALIEKLLRSCPGIANIYALMRPKKGKDIHTRLEELLKNPVFEIVKKENPDVLKKIIPIGGDVSDDGLGISPDDLAKLVNVVSIVFHSAATLDFESTLRPTVVTNLLGTQRVVQFCHKLPKLKVLVHVSTAYANCPRKEVDEILYPTPGDAEKVISFTDCLKDDALNELTPSVLGEYPNTYTFTKALAEHEVAKAMGSFPVTIVRPSIILGARKEPVPGWINSMNGPSGFIMGAARGIIRRLPLKEDVVYDYIPVDVVVNELIVAGWYAGTTNSETIPIFHCTTSTQKPFVWANVKDKVNYLLRKYPVKGAVWSPTMKFVPSILHFKFSSIFVHFLPGYVLDTVAKLTGQRPIVVRLHKRVNASLGLLQYFIFNEWKFNNEKSRELVNKLSVKDRELFDIDLNTLEWGPYIEDFTLGVRRYLNKEEDRTLPAARKKLAVFNCMDFVLQVLLLVLLWWIFSKMLGFSMIGSIWCLPVIYFLLSLL